MADNGSSDTYTVLITLITEAGDLPNQRDVEDLIAAQMGGELDDPACNGGTGLFCGGVAVLGAQSGDDDPFQIISNMVLEAKEYLARGAVNTASDLLDGIYRYIDAECT